MLEHAAYGNHPPWYACLVYLATHCVDAKYNWNILKDARNFRNEIKWKFGQPWLLHICWHERGNLGPLRALAVLITFAASLHVYIAHRHAHLCSKGI